MDIITIVSHTLHMNTGALVGYLTLLVTVCNLLGRVIPDSAVGWLGTVRKVCKVVGLYVGNRITPGVSANEVAAGVMAVNGPAAAIASGDAPAVGSVVPNEYRTDPGKPVDSTL